MEGRAFVVFLLCCLLFGFWLVLFVFVLFGLVVGSLIGFLCFFVVCVVVFLVGLVCFCLFGLFFLIFWLLCLFCWYLSFLNDYLRVLRLFHLRLLGLYVLCAVNKTSTFTTCHVMFVCLFRGLLLVH